MASWKRSVLSVGRRSGALRTLGPLYGRHRLTVLAYHRVASFGSPGFDTDVRNVSADEAAFTAQMAYLADRFAPIGLDRLVGWLDGDADLPERPVLVTFDDGYRDNLTAAWPIMRDHGIPGVLLPATSALDTGEPFLWDLAAYCFRTTARTDADLPSWGRAAWSNEEERRSVEHRWSDVLKARPHAERVAAHRALPESLGVDVPDDAFGDLYLDWDEVRRLDGEGFTIGAHTVTHPILTRVDPETARREIEGGAARVAEELGRRPVAFAYPNGLGGDFDGTTIEMVRDAGFRVAFSLLPGPTRTAEAVESPLTIRRTYVHHGDHLDRFVLNVEGGARIRSRIRLGRVPGRR